MPVMISISDFDVLPTEPARLKARKVALEKDLDRMLQLRGPVTEVRRLVADLDRVAAELARSLRDDMPRVARDASQRAADHYLPN